MAQQNAAGPRPKRRRGPYRREEVEEDTFDTFEVSRVRPHVNDNGRPCVTVQPGVGLGLPPNIGTKRSHTDSATASDRVSDTSTFEEHEGQDCQGTSELDNVDVVRTVHAMDMQIESDQAIQSFNGQDSDVQMKCSWTTSGSQASTSAHFNYGKIMPHGEPLGVEELGLGYRITTR